MRPDLRNPVAILALAAWLGGAAVVIVAQTGGIGADIGASVIVAIALGDRNRYLRAATARLLAEQVARGELNPAAIDEQRFAAQLHTAGDADPDLLIRTSGEQRISNFLLWQLAYAELHITDVLWPDFDESSLTAALLDYQSRQRRFGGVEPVR